MDVWMDVCMFVRCIREGVRIWQFPEKNHSKEKNYIYIYIFINEFI